MRGCARVNTIFSRYWVGRDYFVTSVTGSTWLFRDLHGCYGVCVRCPALILRKSQFVALMGHIREGVTLALFKYLLPNSESVSPSLERSTSFAKKYLNNFLELWIGPGRSVKNLSVNVRDLSGPVRINSRVVWESGDDSCRCRLKFILCAGAPYHR